MEIILENAFVKKAITMITKIAFAWNAHNFGKIINSTFIIFCSNSCFYNN